MKLNEETGLYENYGYWHIPFWQTHNFKMAVVICCIIVLLLLIGLIAKKYLDYRRRKKLPIWDQAFLELAQLKKAQKVTVQNGKHFYALVSLLLKRYLQDRFGYDLLGKTDSEAIDYLETQSFDTYLLEEFKVLLQGSQIIKFANELAAQEQIDQDYIRAFSIIQGTIPEKK